jgi:hypothetical protein
VFLYASLLKLALVGMKLRTGPDRLESAVSTFNQTYCDPPLSAADCRATTRSVAGFTHGLRTRTMSDRLNITPAEAKVTGWPCASCFLPPPMKQQREQALRELLREPGKAKQSHNSLARQLTRLGLPTTSPTVKKYRERLGI